MRLPRELPLCALGVGESCSEKSILLTELLPSSRLHQGAAREDSAEKKGRGKLVEREKVKKLFSFPTSSASSEHTTINGANERPSTQRSELARLLIFC